MPPKKSFSKIVQVMNRITSPVLNSGIYNRSPSVPVANFCNKNQSHTPPIYSIFHNIHSPPTNPLSIFPPEPLQFPASRQNLPTSLLNTRNISGQRIQPKLETGHSEITENSLSLSGHNTTVLDLGRTSVAVHCVEFELCLKALKLRKLSVLGNVPGEERWLAPEWQKCRTPSAVLSLPFRSVPHRYIDMDMWLCGYPPSR
jgi:hypothetical protein